MNAGDRRDTLAGIEHDAFGMEAAENTARRDALDALTAIGHLKSELKPIEDALKFWDPSASDYPKMGALRRFLHDHEGERLEDPESGYAAWLQPGGETTTYDPPNAIQKRDRKLYARLKELGCLVTVLDAKKLAEVVKAGLLVKADLDPFTAKGQRSASLKVERGAQE